MVGLEIEDDQIGDGDFAEELGKIIRVYDLGKYFLNF